MLLTVVGFCDRSKVNGMWCLIMVTLHAHAGAWGCWSRFTSLAQRGWKMCTWTRYIRTSYIRVKHGHCHNESLPCVVNKCGPLRGRTIWKIERKANQCDDKCVIGASALYIIRFWEWARSKSDLIWFDLTLWRWEQIRLRGLMWSCQWLTGLLLLLQCYCSTSVKPALAFSFILTLAHGCSLIRSRRFHITH